MKPTYQIRLAVPDDPNLISEHRAPMYRDMGAVNHQDIERLQEACRPYLRAALESGQYMGWLVENVQDGVVAGAGVSFRELAPHPGCYRAGRMASIGNVYTVPTHRRRGLARMLMETILRWCNENAIDQITLAASEQGKPLYQLLGFVPTEDMRLQVFETDRVG
jgi:GNAT superfamily N-acetyltransferase